MVPTRDRMAAARAATTRRRLQNQGLGGRFRCPSGNMRGQRRRVVLGAGAPAGHRRPTRHPVGACHRHAQHLREIAPCAPPPKARLGAAQIDQARPLNDSANPQGARHELLPRQATRLARALSRPRTKSPSSLLLILLHRWATRKWVTAPHLHLHQCLNHHPWSPEIFLRLLRAPLPCRPVLLHLFRRLKSSIIGACPPTSVAPNAQRTHPKTHALHPFHCSELIVLMHALTVRRASCRVLVWGDEGRQLPAGVNLAKLEMHLSHAQFAEVLGMDRARFYALSRQDQMRRKQEVGLF